MNDPGWTRYHSPIASADVESASRRRLVVRRRFVALGAIGLVVLVAVAVALSPDNPRKTLLGRSNANAAINPAIAAGVGRKRRLHRIGNDDRAINRVLAYTSYLTLGHGRKPEVALTFDDGPGPYTSQVLGVLRRMHAAATFFVIGRLVPLMPKLLRDEVSDGFPVGDHTQNHAFLSQISTEAQAAEIDRAANEIRQAGVPSPRLFRPPYGAFRRSTVRLLRSRRMLMVLWSVDTKDYSRPGVDRIVYVALSGAQPGAVILMHDGGGDRSETVQALPRIISGLRRRGFRLVTVPQLLADDPPPRHQPPPRSLSGGV